MEHRTEEVVARAQDKGVGGDPLVEGAVPHQENNVTPVLVLVKVMRSVWGRRGGQL